jgi:cell division protein FtsW
MRRVVQGSGVQNITRRHRPDYQIVLYMGLLMMLGLVVMYAIGPQRANVLNNAYGTDYYSSMYFFLKQTVSLLFALGAFTVLALLPFQLIKKNAAKIVVVGLAVCALLFLTGNVFHMGIAQCSLGACRWFDLGPLGSVQPAELLKFGLLVFTAGFLAMRAKQGLIDDLHRTLIPLGALVLVAVFFVVGLQKDMGTGIAMVAIIGAIMMVAGTGKKIGATLLGIAVVVGAILVVVAPHRVERIATFLAGDQISEQSKNDESYHITHAKIAIGSGGMGGVGIGNSVQATGYLPEAINDSVFAIMGETFGFIGLVIILALFAALLLRLLRIADHLPDMWMKLTVVGVFGWLAAHVILNVAAMIGVFPLTGITLPLLSFGGTSMIFISGALGLAFQLSRYTLYGPIKEENEHENLGSRRGLGGTRYTGRSGTTRT